MTAPDHREPGGVPVPSGAVASTVHLQQKGVRRPPGKLAADDLSAEQRDLYDAIVGGPRAAGPQLFSLTDEEGRLEGPFNAMLLSPPLGAAVQSLGAAVRYGSLLTSRGREIAILVVAHALQSTYEIYAHEAVGRSAGLDDVELSGLRAGDHDVLVDPQERLVAVTAHALCVRSDLDDAEFTAAQQGLGDRTLFELTTLVGYYALIALQLKVYRVEPPPTAPA